MADLDIVHITRNLGLGGTEKSAQILAEEQDENHSVQLYSYEAGEREKILEEKGVPVEVLEPEKLHERLESSGKKDVIHFHGDGFSPEIVETANCNAAKVCKTTNFGWVDYESEEYFDYVFFPSKMTLYRFSKIRSGMHSRAPEKFRLLYYPMRSMDQDEDFRDRIDIDSDTKLVGKIGRSAEGKWANITIRGFKELADSDKNFHLLLVSPPDSIEDVVEEMELSSKVTFMERIDPDKVYKFYNTIDVLAHSSDIGESFGYVLAESIRAGTPVVVDSTPMRDNAQVELIDSHDEGFIANSVEAYSNSLKKAAEEDLSPGLSDEISAEKVVSRLENFYLGKLNEEYSVNLEDFESEYNGMIRDIQQPVPFFYKTEVLAWDLASSFPIFRHMLYDVLRGFFQSDRKLYSLIGEKIDQ